MTYDSNAELPTANEVDFDSDDASSPIDNDIAEFELNSSPSEGKRTKQNAKRTYLAKKKIEELQEERRLKKFDEDYYDSF
tara:strand:+ start:309 stop:548 length:240 start_codon:yes stop_codon:yes gene_type:complete